MLYVLDEPTTGLHFDDIVEAARGVPEAAAGRPQPARHRAQPRRAEDRRLDHRSRSRRRRGGRPSRRGRHARAGCRRSTPRTRDNICAGSLRPAATTRTLIRHEDQPDSPAPAARRAVTRHRCVAAVALRGARARRRSPSGRTSSAICAIPNAETRLAAVDEAGRCRLRAGGRSVAPLLADPDDRVQMAALDAELSFFLTERHRRVAPAQRRRLEEPRAEAFDTGPLLASRQCPRRRSSSIGSSRRCGTRTRASASTPSTRSGFIAEPPLPAAQALRSADELDHYDPIIRAATARVLGRLHAREAGDKLMVALADSSPTRPAVRHRSARPDSRGSRAGAAARPGGARQEATSPGRRPAGPRAHRFVLRSQPVPSALCGPEPGRPPRGGRRARPRPRSGVARRHRARS